MNDDEIQLADDSYKITRLTINGNDVPLDSEIEVQEGDVIRVRGEGVLVTSDILVPAAKPAAR